MSDYEFFITNSYDGLTNGIKDFNHEFAAIFNEQGNCTDIADLRENLNFQEARKSQNDLSYLLKKADESDAQLADFLVENSNQKIPGDNISVSVCNFQGSTLGVNLQTGIFGVIFDGHGGDEVSRNCINFVKQHLRKK